MHRPIKSLIRSTLLALSPARLLAGLADFIAAYWRKYAVLAGLALALPDAHGAIPAGWNLLAGNPSGVAGVARDAQGGSAVFSILNEIVVDSSGNVYVTDGGNKKIRKITASGLVSTVATFSYPVQGLAINSAGSFLYTTVPDVSAVYNVNSGTGVQTELAAPFTFSSPYGVEVDATGNVYVSNTGFNLYTITKINTSDTAALFAGADGAAVTTRFKVPMGLVIDGGYLYVADKSYHAIRRVRLSDGLIENFAGTPGTGTAGTNDGIGTAAQFYSPEGLATDGTYLYVTDNVRTSIRKIKISDQTVTTLATGFTSLTDVAVDGAGYVYATASSQVLTTGAGVTVPTVSTVSPTSGTIAGGTSVTVTGTNFTGATAVSFDGTAAASFTVNSATSITAVSPVKAASTGHITVTTANGTSTTVTGDQYTFSAVTVPGAPTGATATRGNGQASVAFTAPVSDGGASITGYTVTSSGGQTGTGSSSPIIVTGLTNGTSYTFTVTATNSAGTGSASSASAAVTPATVPGAPTIGTASAGNAQATVTFTAPVSNGGDSITSYTVTSSPGGFTATGASSPRTVTGLTNGTAYTFTVTATNSVGTGAASGASNSVTPVTVPTVTTPTSASVTQTTATLGGNVTGDGGASVTARGVVFAVTATNASPQLGGSGVTTAAGTGTTGAFTVNVTGLTGNTGYSYAAYATNSQGTTYSAAGTFTTSPTVPGAPTIGSATRGNTQATVTFTAPGSTGGTAITGYTVTSSPAGGTDSNAGSTGLSHLITGLANGTSYTFTVTATNAVGPGAASSASSAITPKVTSYAGGTGTSGSPYLITSLEDLQELQVASQTSDQTGVYFLQAADIDMASVANWPGIGSVTYPFKGQYDGGRHALTSLTISEAAVTDNRVYSGLFNLIGSGAQVQYLAVTGASVAARGTDARLGVLTANASAATITNVYVTGTLAQTNVFSAGGDSTGALVGRSEGGTVISFCYSRVAVSGQRVVAGMVGIQSGAPTKLINSFMAGSTSGGSFVGQLVGDFQAGTLANVPYTTAAAAKGAGGGTVTSCPASTADTVFKSAANFQSSAGYFSANWDFATVWKLDAAQNSGFPIFRGPATAPDAPTIGTATRGDTQATVTFTAPADAGGSAITGYTVTSIPAGGTDSNAGSTGLSHVITGLTNGTSYTFTVTAANAVGTSSAS
ncbi:MAG: fibronectin type III domain-containing protein, partial [Opitutales bacterium]|nr:fibronectin type III domain-containing protein [Opitutales bacterium]